MVIHFAQSKYSAFIHLHQWRLSSIDSSFSAQERLESCDAIETVMKIIAATGANGPQNFPCHSPYSIQLIYQLSISIRYIQQHGRSHLENWTKVLLMMLEQQRGRWKIAGSQGLSSTLVLSLLININFR